MVNFKRVSVDLGTPSDYGGEWMYMLDDGTVVYSWQLIIEDNKDYRAAKAFGWSAEEIKNIDDRLCNYKSIDC